MPLLDAHFTPLLCALAALAVTLGIAANVLAVRLLAEMGCASNDPVYRTPRYAARPRIALHAVR